jgi:ribonuclease Z
MLRVTFLGTSGSIPTVERGMPALAIKYESELMLWDCGEGTQRQMMRYKVGYGSISAIFISHPHIDHYLGLFGLLETLKLSSPSPKKLRLFMPKAVGEPNYDFVATEHVKSGELYRGKGFSVSAFQVKHCRGAYGFVFQEGEKVKFHEEKAHSLGLKGRMFKEIQQKGKLKLGGREVALEDVTWKQPGRKIVYSGDCTPDQHLLDAARGADLLIHEGTFDASLEAEARERLHSTVKDAASTAKEAGVKQLVITHISPRYSDSASLASLLEQARQVFPGTGLASDGLSIDI